MRRAIDGTRAGISGSYLLHNNQKCAQNRHACINRTFIWMNSGVFGGNFCSTTGIIKKKCIWLGLLSFKMRDHFATVIVSFAQSLCIIVQKYCSRGQALFDESIAGVKCYMSVNGIYTRLSCFDKRSAYLALGAPNDLRFIKCELVVGA